jgi:hypothetical protein
MASVLNLNFNKANKSQKVETPHLMLNSPSHSVVITALSIFSLKLQNL